MFCRVNSKTPGSDSNPTARAPGRLRTSQCSVFAEPANGSTTSAAAERARARGLVIRSAICAASTSRVHSTAVRPSTRTPGGTSRPVACRRGTRSPRLRSCHGRSVRFPRARGARSSLNRPATANGYRRRPSSLSKKKRPDAVARPAVRHSTLGTQHQPNALRSLQPSGGS